MVVETFAGRALAHPRRAYALLAEPVDPVVDALRLDFRRAYRDVFAEIVQAGVAAGELPEQNPDLVAAALVGAVGEALVGPVGPLALAERPGGAAEHLVTELATVVIRALGTAPEAAPAPATAGGHHHAHA